MIRAGLLAALLAAAAFAQTLEKRDVLAAKVREATSAFQGMVSLYAKNLDTGATFGIRENEPVRTASTIKLPIMAMVYQAVADGRANLGEELTIRAADKVSGSGVLREFSDGVKLPIRDVVHMMIVVSDNTATNMILERFSAEAVNEMMDKLGLKQTRSLRKVLGNGPPSGFSKAGRLPENEKYGLGVTTPREMVMLLEKLERGEVVSPAASREMLEVLKRQQDGDGMRRRFAGTPVANKTGALDRLRSDVGIIYSPGGRIAIAITCDDMPKGDYNADHPGLLMIAQLSQVLVQYLSK